MSDVRNTPTLARWRLGREMQRLRVAAGLSPGEAGALIGVVRQTISRMERGAVAVGIDRIEALCRRYGATPETTMAMTSMAVRGGERGWWEKHKRGVNRAFRMYVEAEVEADTIDMYEPEFIPGLAQTADYIRQLHIDPADDVDDIVAARIARQTRVFRPGGPQTRMLIGIGAMLLLGSIPADVRDGQVKRLRELADTSQADIRVSVSVDAALGAPFAILGFAEPDDLTFVYMDALDGCRYENDADVLSSYRAAFARAWNSATPVERYLNENAGRLA